MIYHEYLLCERQGCGPSADQFAARFPEYASTIRDQIALHQALEPDEADGEKAEYGESTYLDPSATASLQARPLPAPFGRYMLLERLGQGGMGVVYRAHDSQLARSVALKMLRLEQDAGGRQIGRFLREARIAAGFHHPNLCPVYDAGVEQGVPFIAMPVLFGESLAARLARSGTMPARAAASLVQLLAKAIAVAHAAGVVHRDLKPSNVMITSEGTPVVIDFGLARSTEPADRILTGSGLMVGTPAYIAPEQIGGGSAAGPAADIYSLGVILYQALTGRPPFQGEAHEILRHALIGDPPLPSQIRPGLDPPVQSICLKAMARQPRDRYPSMEAFADDLGRYLSGDWRVPETAATGRRRQLLGLLAAAILVSGLGVAGIARLTRTAGPRPADRLDSLSALASGSVWSGSFRFRPPNDAYSGNARLAFIETAGPRIKARYETEEGKFAWLVAGSRTGNAIHLEFTDAIRDTLSGTLVGRARLTGQLQPGFLKLVFVDDDSTADLVLFPVR